MLTWNDTGRSIKFTTVEETLSHPAFQSAIWDLQPDQQGRLPVGKSRGGPVHIEWEIHGVGPTKIALIMGLAGTKAGWQFQTKHFGHDRSEQYSVLVIDNRGAGGSDKLQALWRYSTSEMALDVAEVLEHVGWMTTTTTTMTTAEERGGVHLVGISMGGMVAQEFACRFPTRLQSLNLLCTSAQYQSPSPADSSLVDKVANAFNFLKFKSEEQSIMDMVHKVFTDEFLAGEEDASLLPQSGDTHKCGPARGHPQGTYTPFDSNFQRIQAQELTKMRTPGYRSYNGFLGQLLAVVGHKKTPEQLCRMADGVGRERILILHGTRDTMIALPQGENLMQIIKPAKALVVDGMAHAPNERIHWFHGILEEHFAACAKLP